MEESSNKTGGETGGGGEMQPPQQGGQTQQGMVVQQVMQSQETTAVLQQQQAVAAMQQQQQQQQQQMQQQQQQQMEQSGGNVMAAQQNLTSSPQNTQQQALIVNAANIQQQMQSVGTPGSPLCSMAQMQQQSNNTTMQSQLMPMSAAGQQALGNMSLQQGVASGSTTITTMSTLQQPVPPNTPGPQLQQVTDWNTGRVQVIQQPMQNTAYVQQLYNTQGQMLMSGNIALHAAPNMNPGSIQVITAAKPFQSNQLTSHVLGKPVLTGAQQTSFPSYATIPTTSNPTLVIGQLVSSQPNILPAQSGNQPKQEMHKYTATCNSRGVTNQNGVQLSPWQFQTQIPHVWTAPHHPQVGQVITAQNPIFIRSPHQEQPMFIQSPPPQNIQQQQQPQQGVSVGKQENKTGVGGSQVSRTLSILPSVSAPIRPASSVATQIIQKQPANKLRTKAILTKTSIPIQKLDAQNQTKPQPISPQQHVAPSNKMIITSQGTLMPQQQMQTDKVTSQQQQQQQQVQQQVQAALQQQQQQLQQQQQAVAVAVAAGQQQALQQQVAAAQLQQQQQMVVAAQQQLHQQALQQQMIQPKPPPLMSIGVGGSGSGLVMQQSPQQVGMQQMKDKLPTATLLQTQQQQQPALIHHKPVVEGLTDALQEEAVDDPMEQQEGCDDKMEIVNGGTEESAPVVMEETKEKVGVPKAMVKPQVLTHVIEGYVIQESSEPFPINRSSLLTELAQSAKTETRSPVMMDADEPPLKKQSMDTSLVAKSDKAKCEFCGKIDLREKFKKTKRFCSISCAKRFNVNSSKRASIKPTTEENKQGDKAEHKKDWGDNSCTDVETSDSVSGGEASEAGDSMAPNATQDDLPNPLKWSVSEVCDFIRKLPGCSDYAEDFLIQEIDGQALMLLKEDHLMSAMSMKLGPALKICAKIDTMRSPPPGTPPTPQPQDK